MPTTELSSRSTTVTCASAARRASFWPLLRPSYVSLQTLTEDQAAGARIIRSSQIDTRRLGYAGEDDLIESVYGETTCRVTRSSGPPLAGDAARSPISSASGRSLSAQAVRDTMGGFLRGTTLRSRWVKSPLGPAQAAVGSSAFGSRRHAGHGAWQLGQRCPQGYNLPFVGGARR